MTEVHVIRELLSELDWPQDVVLLPVVANDTTRLVHEHFGEGAGRWIVGSVEKGKNRIRDWADADVLAPWPEITMLAQDVVARALLESIGVAVPATDHQIEQQLAAEIVSRSVSVTAAVQSFRVMQDEWVKLLVQAATQADRVDVVPRLVGVLSSAVDDVISTLLLAIDDERRQMFRRGPARQRQMIEAIVNGGFRGEQAAAETLGIAMEGWHIGCVLHTPVGEYVSRTEMDVVVNALISTTRAEVLTHETATGQIWIWASSADKPSDVSMESLHIPSPIIAGVGIAHRGILGFRQTLIEAQEALRISKTLIPASRGHLYTDAGLLALLSENPEHARWFVASELKELAEDTADMHELRQTVGAFFASKMRMAPAAEKLYVHRNTMQARLNRVEQILGHALADRSLECQAALLLHGYLEQFHGEK